MDAALANGQDLAIVAQITQDGCQLGIREQTLRIHAIEQSQCIDLLQAHRRIGTDLVFHLVSG